MSGAEVPERAPPGEREVPLGSDMVAFLLICPPLGAMLCTFGLSIIGLMLQPVGTIGLTILFGSFPALASLVAARGRRTGYVNVPIAPGFCAAGAMAIILERHSTLLNHRGFSRRGLSDSLRSARGR